MKEKVNLKIEKGQEEDKRVQGGKVGKQRHLLDLNTYRLVR